MQAKFETYFRIVSLSCCYLHISSNNLRLPYGNKYLASDCNFDLDLSWSWSQNVLSLYLRWFWYRGIFRRSLQRRASELQEKLKAAGVGSRPIIWVTHSMGGQFCSNIVCIHFIKLRYSLSVKIIYKTHDSHKFDCAASKWELWINIGCDIYATFSSPTNKKIFFSCVTLRNYETTKDYHIWFIYFNVTNLYTIQLLGICSQREETLTTLEFLFLQVFVWNSFTGLLVKELLCQSDQKPDYSDIVDNTSGVIFYSTPHRGSALANISSRGSRILSPTVEVQELSRGKTPQCGE